ncbi:MAG: hypothetical protein LBB79_00900 [Prevotellaceae bacterium]|nr:hypothetical protein [Prevotellaceae bacterium]
MLVEITFLHSAHSCLVHSGRNDEQGRMTNRKKNIAFTSSKKDGNVTLNGIKENSDLSVASAVQYFRPILYSV